MTKTAPRTTTKSFSSPAGSISRLIIAALLLSNLVACAVAPSAATPDEPVTQPGLDNGIAGATDMYNSQDYPSAIQAYDNVTKSADASANERRLAHLGKALIYLGNDKNWHSLDNAKLALVSAGQVAPAAGEEFAAETALLMDAVTDVIGTESKYIELQSKTGNSSAELGRLKNERDALKAERDQLLKEQKTLNEALEKLKSLTLGD